MDTTRKGAGPPRRRQRRPPPSWPADVLPLAIAAGDDLVAVGGDLAPERLLDAYSRGVFPWYEEGDPILWWSPDPRAVLDLARVRVPPRLRRKIRNGGFTTTVDRDFPAVIRECARRRAEGTWITSEMIEAYTGLHELGHAHSVECRLGERLVGGIYGVSIGGFFAGESMFWRVPDASKIALVALVARLRERGFELFDLQVLNEHTRRLGAREITRRRYLERLRAAVGLPVTFGASEI